MILWNSRVFWIHDFQKSINIFLICLFYNCNCRSFLYSVEKWAEIKTNLIRHIVLTTPIEQFPEQENGPLGQLPETNHEMANTPWPDEDILVETSNQNHTPHEKLIKVLNYTY